MDLNDIIEIADAAVWQDNALSQIRVLSLRELLNGLLIRSMNSDPHWHQYLQNGYRFNRLRYVSLITLFTPLQIG